jgi:hypothetical protein
MCAAEIVERAAVLRVRLWIEGKRIGMAGPSHNVAALKPEIAAHKPEIMAYLRAAANEAADCAGALTPDGGAYLPWGPYLSPADVRRMRGELFDMIDERCRFEGWSSELRHDTMTRAMRGPLSDLMPNLAYFHGQFGARGVPKRWRGRRRTRGHGNMTGGRDEPSNRPGRRYRGRGRAPCAARRRLAC